MSSSRLIPSPTAVALGAAVSLLGFWVDDLYIPMILLGPVMTGALAAARGISFPWVVQLWLSAGITSLVVDWIVYNEDKVFHAAVTVVMVALAGVGFGLVRLATRSRRRNLSAAGDRL